MTRSVAPLLAACAAAAMLLTSSACASKTWSGQDPSTRDARPTHRFRKSTRIGTLSPGMSRPAVLVQADASSNLSIDATIPLPKEALVPGGHG
ncbi:MAG TPA: hypothetical protein VEL28_14110 [Candidatus Binatia bacterium]|nr:hypothetical protein [Candidatus Binatia bacterium]